ncbi:hypothetical protein HMN09_01219100 [Mycena chlorophos]|uniref:Uncharacterized protein n=1 Tax=Mycena chlorophos TaxID=658473 RepID=A0A8H6VUF0_MYCCL|nr:hypothetical protein HMN09_01219100 [Mycena chlorophos]
MRRALLRATTTPPLAPHRAMYMSRRPHFDEVVEDSEPEREAQRQALRQERKKRKLATSTVIVISDDSLPASPAAPVMQAQSVIDISDSSSDPEEGAPALDTNADATESEADEEVVPSLNLAHFAFKGTTRPLQQRNSGSTIGSSSSGEVPTKPAPRRSRKKLNEDIPENDLKKLYKCVSCEMPWTTRKTAAQKLVHIRSCAKKTGITHETLVFLVRKEVENSPSVKGKEPAGPSTLLEEVVRDAGPKRKTKRRAPIDILKNASETRDNILDRARSLLHAQGDAPRTQAVVPDPSAAPPATQTFGTSRLGQQRGRPLLLESDDEMQPPAASQAFAPSKLGAMAKRTSGWGYESASEEEAPVATTSQLNRKDASGSASPATRRTKAIVLRSRSRSRSPTPASDDGYIHYDPDAAHKRGKRAAAEDLDEASLLAKILADHDLHHQILRYEAVDFNTFLALVVKPGHVATLKLKLQLRVFLDKQAIIFFGDSVSWKPKERTRKRR